MYLIQSQIILLKTFFIITFVPNKYFTNPGGKKKEREQIDISAFLFKVFGSLFFTKSPLFVNYLLKVPSIHTDTQVVRQEHGSVASLPFQEIMTD